MKLGKRITALALSACMLLGVAFVPTQAQEAGNGSGHRGDAYNNGITTAKTPVAKEETGLLWATKLGSKASPALIVNDSVYAYSENKIYKLNKNTGKVEAEGTLDVGLNSWGFSNEAFGSSTYPVAYGDGKIYVGLSDCRIQALDAEKLTSKWIYSKESPGEFSGTNSPIVYKDRKIYVGFYPGSNTKTAFVCINTESGEPEWDEYEGEENGSFQANGAAIVGNYVVYGNNTTGNIISRNKDNGKLIETLPVDSAGIKSGIVCNNGKIYCVASKANNKATLVVADFDSTTGKFKNLQTTDFSAYGTYSVNTPVVYNGIVYVGAGGYRQVGNVVAINPAKEKEEERILWAKSVSGYPEGAIMLSSAYEKEEDAIYLYTTYNYTRPDGIDVVKVKADGSSAEEYNLFTNESAYIGMSTSSITADEEGTLYYGNQSGYIVAVGTTATKVESIIEKLPAEDKISLDDEDAVKAAKAAYERLSAEQKKLVREDKVQVLEKAEAKIESLKKDEADKEAAKAVISQIEKLGKETIDLTKENQVKEARAAYDKLTDDQKKLVTNLSVLEKAEQTVKDLKAAQSSSTEGKTDTKPGAASTEGKTNTTKANPVIKAGMTVKTDSGKEYVKILSTTKKRVAYVKSTKKSAKNITVSSTVKVSGETYKVVAVCSGAFKKMPKLQKVTIGNNVEEIGAKAFYKSKKLNKIVITSKKLTSRKVSTKAFSGTNKKVTVKVPKKKYKAYKKFLAKSGNKTIRLKKF